jgi:RNA polymerase sigma factor (sigma-70 family)
MDTDNAAGRAAGIAGPCRDIEDAALIAQSLQTPERFGVLFDRHAPAIYRYIARRLGRDTADDLMAETFLAAFRQRGRYDRAHPDARPWLYGIATRLIGRYRRDEIRFFRAIARTGVDPAAELIADQVTSRVAAQAASRELAAAIAALPPGYRDVLLLIASGLGYQETAIALGVPVGTVSSRLLRARQRVRALIGDPMQADDKGE